MSIKMAVCTTTTRRLGRKSLDGEGGMDEVVDARPHLAVGETRDMEDVFSCEKRLGEALPKEGAL